MRSKRLFAVLLAFCLVFTALAPAASAVAAPALSAANAQKSAEKEVATKNETSPNANGLLVSEDTHKGLLNLRENPLLKVEVNNNDEDDNKNQWNVQPAEGKPSVSLLSNEIKANLEELKAAAELYSADEVVSAFVVVEGQPLAETYSSRRLVSAEVEKQMIEKQNVIINTIEKMVLGGEKLEVRYQFTYLTNSFTIMTDFANLEKIAAINGVKSVFLTPVFEPATTATPNTAGSGAMTGVHNVWENLGYTGTGMKIAIIDTGLDLDHPSFAADPETNENSLTTADIEAVLQDLNAYARRSTITAKTLYRSAKVPFAFNYVDSSLTADHSRDQQGDHGTHVAGIAAANATEGTTVVGMAPDAQIIVMKVFGAKGGAFMDDVAAALEDAMLLGCDVVNASLGSPRGFSSSASEIDLIYERLASQDIVATFSAGNEGTSSYDNTWGTDLNRTQNPDNAAVGSPSTWPNTLSIASAENGEVMTDFFSLADGTKVFFQDSMPAIYKNAGYEEYAWAISLLEIADVEYEYVIVPGLGSEEDVASVDVEGKIAVIHRGTLSFAEKVMNAENAGAVGVIIWNTNDTDDIFSFGMGTSSDDYYPAIPAALVTLSDGQKMADAEVKTMTVSKEQAARQCDGGQMSSFSSWGVSPDLQLMPDITGIGGNVYSTLDNGKYGLMSGTSMSAPQIAGVTALVMEHLYTIYPDAPDGTIRNLTEAILMSTADPIISSVSGVETSPRQQGAGLVNAYEATTTTTYLTVGGGRPKAELGDNGNGKFTFSFEIHNIGSEDKTYTMDASLLTEYVTGMRVSATEVEYFMYGADIPLSGSVTFSKEEVTVAAGGRASITATIILSDADKAYFQKYWENGGYVEGYVYLTNEEGAVELNLPFLGFYGDWTDAPVFDTAYWYDNSFWGLNYANGLPEGDEYYNVFWTSLAGQDWVLGMNPYSGALVDSNRNIYYDPANNVVSPNGDGVLDGIEEIYLSLLRNAKNLVFTYTVDGEVMHKEVIENAPKTMYISAYGQIVPFIYSWYGWDMYDFTGLDGKVLPNGTEVLLTIDAYVDYGTGGKHSIQIPITVDTQAPELVAAYELPQENGDHYLFVELAENVSPAAVVLMNPSGSRILAQDYFFQTTNRGTYLIGFDITDMGTEFMVALCDYACNESYYNITYSAAADGNLPEVDTTALYGYRVYDDVLESDHMYGWVSTNKPVTGEYAAVSILTDDYLEYAAITAAEYAGGKVFAVDAVHNFIVLDPGLWNRKTITNIGMTVMDMAFDDVTDTMYLLVKDEWSDSYLYTIDLLTGETEEVVGFGYYNYGPWAITFDTEGTLYAIKVGSSNLFTVNMETGAMTAVTDNDGNTFVMMDENGTKLSPTAYSQSITYSEKDNTIYWAHFKFSWWGSSSGMAAINLDDWTTTYSKHSAQAYNSSNQLVTYYPATEIVGLMVLEETDYVLPEATDLNGIALDAESLILTSGNSAKLTAYPNPWNYELGDVTWTSSDETVATVDGGKVVAVGGGNAVITASYGELTAECAVTVVEIGGHFYAYNYYSGDNNYGYMIDVNMETMNYSLIGAPGADFMAGDYNGHDDNFYGYTEGGQFWRMNMSTGETVALGDPVAALPVDMAYDYSTGFMYALTQDYNTGATVLSAVNLTNGQMITLGTLEYNFLMTLACDLEGNLYALDYEGNMLQLFVEDGVINCEIILEQIVSLNYMQSMCYDHINDVIIWACPENSQIFWVDIHAEQPYAIALGDPTGSGFQFVGLFTVPAQIPALAPVAVESVSAEDMLVLTGGTKLANVSILPLNATTKSFTWTSSDASVATVDGNGAVTGVSDGFATITGVMKDLVSGETFEVSFQVTVITGADNLYGHVLTDIATYDGYYWARLYPADTTNPDALSYTDYIIYAEEYYNGKLYAFGYDPTIWSGASWYMFIMDPETQAVEDMILMDETFPFVYDMTYDYATSTMYAVAGPSENASDLFVVNMETGELTLLMETAEFFMSIAAGPDGKLYAVENSREAMIGFDDWGYEIFGFTNAQLYTIDPIAKEITLVGDTGVQCNMIASMTYDYDTDMLYWTPVFRPDFYSAMTATLCMVDPVNAQAHVLGMVGAAGAQISGLYTICDEFPAEPEPALLSILVAPGKADMVVGGTSSVHAVTLPMTLDCEIVWTSSDIDVATVDENGVITGVAQGSAIITATAEYNGVKMSANCRVAVLAEDATFLSYNVTDGGWAEISRADATIVTNLTEGEEIPVAAFANANGKIYGYDVENTLFELNTETYERQTIGQIDASALIEELLIGYGYTEEEIAELLPIYAFEVRDMDYDAANDRLLIVGNIYDTIGGELYSGNGIYEVNLTDGSVTCLYTFHDHFYVMGMAIDAEGVIYFYNTYNDNYATLDLETGTWQNIISLQSQSFYGYEGGDHALYYDAITGKIYHLFTTNNVWYSLLSLDPVSAAITQESKYVGEVYYDYAVWGYTGDKFAGLTFINEDAEGGMPEVPVTPDYTAEWKQISTTLGGNIGLNFYAKLSADVVNNPETYVQFTYADKVVKVPMADAVESDLNGETVYRFTCKLTAKNMADEVTAQVFTAGGAVGVSKSMDIVTYANWVLENYTDAEIVGLMKALLNYGASAQVLFNYATDNLANAALSEEDQVLADVDASAYAHSVTGSEEGIEIKSMTLLLDSNTTIRFYFALTGDKTIDEYTFTIDGNQVTPVEKGGLYYVELSDIAAHMLGEMHDVTVGGLTVSYAALSYVNQVMLLSTDEPVINMAKALYAYAMAAVAYAG